ncbi:hypothetical protein [Streptomyces sp. NBRC 110611]|nr:hypothetical protein [Streptomyces sp. NBRC 110611]
MSITLTIAVVIVIVIAIAVTCLRVARLVSEYLGSGWFRSG